MEKNVTQFVYDILKPEFVKKGIDMDSFPKNDSMIKAGIIDSMAFVNILLELEAALEIPVDFGAAELDSIVSIDGLKDFFMRNNK